jgi:hypothetical protein
MLLRAARQREPLPGPYRWSGTGRRGGRAQKIKVATMLILWGCFETTIMSLVPFDFTQGREHVERPLKGPRTNVGCGSEQRPPPAAAQTAKSNIWHVESY